MHQHGSKYFAHRHPPWTLGWGQKVIIQLFQNTHMLHIKLKGMMNAAICKHMFCRYMHIQHLGWGQKSKKIFVKLVMLHIN